MVVTACACLTKQLVDLVQPFAPVRSGALNPHG
jgi:hypothetical protein